MAKPASELVQAARSAQRMLFLGAASAFSAALFVSHVLGPITFSLLDGSPESPLWDPFLAGVGLAIVGAPWAWLIARGFELSPRAAAAGVGLLGTLFLWMPTILAGGLEALWAASWSFPLRLVLAGAAAAIAARWAAFGVPGSGSSAVKG